MGVVDKLEEHVAFAISLERPGLFLCVEMCALFRLTDLAGLHISNEKKQAQT